ncbi:MAG: HipA domain-containing protein [Betaproteobacteria bacterium]
MTRALDIFIDTARVASLHENQGIWSLQYDLKWVADGYDLAPGLPLSADPIVDSGSLRPVQWFFDNLLPEDAARTRLFASLPGKRGDSWDLLERFGAESAGALTLLPPGTTQAEEGVQPLSDAELQKRILAMPRQPLGTNAPKKMSLAGAQEKLPVIIDATGALFEPTGARASTHILKPDVLHEQYPASAVNEWFCARLAQLLRLPVPPVELRYVPPAVYIIQRFDRAVTDGKLERVHALDAAQLLSLAAGAKYTASGVVALRDVVAHCRAKAAARIALMRWTLFNALIGNGDAHLKNISLLAGRNGYSLAPHYDLVSTGAWSRPELLGPGEQPWPQVGLSFPIGKARTFGALTAQDCVTFAQELGVPTLTAQRELHRLANAVLPAASKIRGEYEARTDIPAMARAGHLRMLDAIMHLPLRDMVQQLGARFE